MTEHPEYAAAARRGAEEALRLAWLELAEQAAMLNPGGREDTDRAARSATLNRAAGVLADKWDELIDTATSTAVPHSGEPE